MGNCHGSFSIRKALLEGKITRIMALSLLGDNFQRLCAQDGYYYQIDMKRYIWVRDGQWVKKTSGEYNWLHVQPKEDASHYRGVIGTPCKDMMNKTRRRLNSLERIPAPRRRVSAEKLESR